MSKVRVRQGMKLFIGGALLVCVSCLVLATQEAIRATWPRSLWWLAEVLLFAGIPGVILIIVGLVQCSREDIWKRKEEKLKSASANDETIARELQKHQTRPWLIWAVVLDIVGLVPAAMFLKLPIVMLTTQGNYNRLGEIVPALLLIFILLPAQIVGIVFSMTKVKEKKIPKILILAQILLVVVAVLLIIMQLLVIK